MTHTSTAAPAPVRPHLTYTRVVSIEPDPEGSIEVRCNGCKWSARCDWNVEALDLQIAHEQETAVQR
jgi:hypothetical protein